MRLRSTLRAAVVLGMLGGLFSACTSTAPDGIGSASPAITVVPGAVPTIPASDRLPSSIVMNTSVMNTSVLASDSVIASSSVASVTTTLSNPDSQRSEITSSTVLGGVASSAGLRLVGAARSQVGVTTGYDPAYVGLSFPGGDVDASTGVCSDVVVRALRGLGIDLQERLNLDMKAHFSEYPTKWGLSSPDSNIDHRRVPNIATYFARSGYEQPVSADPADYQPGDIVWIKLPLDHIGIVSDRTVDGRPMLIHNVGRGAQEEDVLFSWKIVGLYRVVS